MTATPDPTAPLAGVRVLDLSRLFPGAYCTALLADHGADVVKLEAPGYGDGMRFMGEEFPAAHWQFNRGKRSVTLNLKNEAALDVLRRLARDTDVIVESGRPGSMDKMGVGFDALRADNPGLVWCSISGFGPDGPNVNAPGHDLTYSGYAGVLSQFLVDDVPPVPGMTVAIPFAGILAAFGIVAALQGRACTGVGTRVDANMVDSAIWVLGEQLTRAANTDVQPWGAYAARNNYRCADGKWITCTSSEPRAWAALVEALGLPDLADRKTGDDEPAAIARLEAAFATQTQAHWLETPGLAGGIGPVFAPGDLPDDPQVAHRHGMPRIGGDGPRVVANPLRFALADGVAGSHALSPAPGLGEHTDEVLAAAGYTAEEIAALHDDQAV
jgi:crotonobetainyl-CoA:carnitine CoA-transferase CaiB-like acyl-CoA transferase